MSAIELGNGWRVTLAKTQWTLEQWRNPSWRPRSYCCTRSALVRCIGGHCGGEADLTGLLALPEWHPDREASKGLNSLQTTSDAVLAAKEIISRLERLQFMGRASPTQLALLAPRGIALNELNLHREVPLTDADLVRAFRDQRVDDYPQRAAPQSAGLQLYIYPEQVLDARLGSNPDGSTPGALQGDDFSIQLDANDYPELPACLDRRKLKLVEAA